jgi:deazaflavin-dependent oxidoreductase (nitroreductase family)
MLEKQVITMTQQGNQTSTILIEGPRSQYRRPSWLMRKVVDPLTCLAVRGLGLDDHNGTWVLEAQGRVSGRWRTTPVKVLELDGRHYLVAMYGETDWVRNLRAQGSGRLRLGKRLMAFRAVELSDEAKLPILRAYLRQWWSLVARMTTLTSADASDKEMRRAAPLYPVFLLEEVAGADT